MRPRMLLVDDDAAIRRLVSLSLEDQPLELVCCANGEAALAELARQPVQLLITDLMMPGLNGFALLERLRAEPALRGAARLVVFSAGLQPHEGRLRDLGVEAFLLKPAAVKDLLGLVLRLLGSGAPPPDSPSAPQAAVASRQELIERGFGGDAQLYAAFREACLSQYRVDLREGEDALTRGDAAALQRVAHNLKGSLRTLGEDAAAGVALALERAATQPDRVGQWPALWAELKAELTRIS